MTEAEGLIEKSFEARTRALEAFGSVDADVLSHLINPSFSGGPRWPAMRQAYRVVRRSAPAALLLASDGLSDPFDDEESAANGYGLELCVATPDSIEKIPGSWLWGLIWQMSQTAASRGDLVELLDDMTYISTELYDVEIPAAHQDRFVNDEDRVGVLIGLHAEPIFESIEGPLSPIRFVGLKLLTLAELDHAIDGGAPARKQLAEAFAASDLGWLSSLERQSVLGL